MPLLKFICEDCKNIYEELTSPGKSPKCPACSSKNTKRFYQGKCYFGGAKGSGGCSGSGCSTCKGCSP